MSKRFFGDIGPVRFEGLKSDNPYAYRHYDPSRVVMGKTMAEHLRPAVCYWHNFAWMGTDMFGAPTFERPWDGETMKGARAKADVAFEMFSTLGFPFFSFHDRDVVRRATVSPSSAATSPRSPISSPRRCRRPAPSCSGAPPISSPSALHGGRRDQSRSRMCSPTPRRQVKNAIDATHELGGANYVLWGGREGYETLLNTDLRRSRIKSGASCPWSSSTSTRSASRA